MFATRKNLTKILILPFFSIVSISTFANESNRTIHPMIKKGYSADLQSFNKFSPKKIHKSRVIMSPSGVKIQSEGMFLDDGTGVFIENFEEKRAWILDPKQKIYAETDTEEETEDDDLESGVGGIMSTQACMDMEPKNKKLMNKKTVGDDSIIIWHCLIGDNIIKQEYSEKWKIVVLEELPDGETSKLTNIRPTDFTSDFFKPSENFRKVSLREFYLGAEALKPYK